MEQVTCSAPDCERPAKARGRCGRHYMRWWLDTPEAERKALRATRAGRFWAKVDRSNPDACWPWLASVAPNGYGQFWDDGLATAHRVAYELLVGPIPNGLTLDHLCRNRACVNPAHLEPVTGRENGLRGDNPAAQNARKTHCVRGHAFSEANTYTPPGGTGRVCRICSAARRRRYKARARESHPARSGRGVPIISRARPVAPLTIRASVKYLRTVALSPLAALR